MESDASCNVPRPIHARSLTSLYGIPYINRTGRQSSGPPGKDMALTERIEVRLNEDVVSRVDEWMERTGNASSRSDAIRQLVELGLGTVTGKAIHLTAGDKLNFTLLRDIAKHLKVETDVDTEFISEVMYGGHYWAPTWEMQGLFHDHADSPSSVRMVADVMSMWTAVEDAIKNLSPSDLDLVKAAHYGYLPKFEGFDGNDETELMAIARFLVQHMRRFTDFKGRDFNAHAPTSETYRRMYRAFEPMRRRLDHRTQLDAKQIVELVEAGKIA